MRRASAVHPAEGQLHRGQRPEAEAGVGPAEQRVDAVAQHLPAAASVRRRADPVAVEQMRGRRAPVGTEGIAQIVFEVLYHFRYTLCDLRSLLIDLRRVVAVLRAGAQIRAQLLIALKAAAAGVDQLLCVLRTLLHQMVDRHKRIRHNGQAVDQAAASVIFGSLLRGVADVHCRFQSALKAA